MSDLIGRYVHDVIRRLPEKDREEVDRELTSNIYDMLPDTPSEDDIVAVLNTLGAPAVLAEQYRQSPRYLISPAIFDNYVNALKWIVPLVGLVLMAVGILVGILESFEEGASEIGAIAAKIALRGWTLGISGVFQAVFWTTAGFAIAERAGAKFLTDTDAWTVDKLPQQTPASKKTISFSDSMAELIITVVGTAVLVLLCLGVFPVAFVFSHEGVTVTHIFTESFLAVCLPVFVVAGVLGVIECVAKLSMRRWTPAVCIAVIINNVIGVFLVLYLSTRPNIFTVEFAEVVKHLTENGTDMMSIPGGSIENLIVFIIAGIVIICALVGCATALYNTIQRKG